MQSVLKWLKGLAAATIGGAANAVVLLIADPQAFNFTDGLQRLITVTVVSGIVSAAAYLKQSPLPNGT